MSTSDSNQPRPPPELAPPRPRIPENIIDIPSQRLYSLSLGLLCQAIKAFDFLQYLWLSDNDSAHYGRKWLIVDFLYCITLSQLRIPRLNYAKSLVILQILLLWTIDGFLFGGISFHLGVQGTTRGASLSSSSRGEMSSSFLDRLGLGMFTSYGNQDPHLLGQHTVRMSPIGTAQLNPHAHTFCLASPAHSILIPILLNNTNPTSVQYTLTPLGYASESTLHGDKSKNGKIERFELKAKDLKAIESARLENLQLARATPPTNKDSDDYDEYDDDDEENDKSRLAESSLQRTQTLVYIKVNTPGVVHLDRVLEHSTVDARLIYPSEVIVVPCPRAEFAEDSEIPTQELIRCAAPGLSSGAGEERKLNINVYGVPPLSLRWYRDVNGRREPFMVEGIEAEDHTRVHAGDVDRRSTARNHRVAHELQIPLTVVLDALGTHTYVLESVTDAFGNVIQASSTSVVPSKIHRSVRVLRRPTVSFKNCKPGVPASLLIGSEAKLTVAANDADELDGPWDVTLQYQPLPVDEIVDSKSKVTKPWRREMQTPEGQKELTVSASAPGEYTIVGVKGNYCEGDVLSPDTCRVVERPMPTAEIEWKKIHECSGDTGVSASLVFHGTPPFQVAYRMQRDSEPPREFVKTFPGSRGELTIQPERSGHYTFSFVQLSDANYKKVDLKGPSINQIVHPPASVDFVHNTSGAPGKKRVNSCSGNIVDVELDLRGTRPWSIDLRVVGPKGSEIIHVTNITTSRKALQVPVPKAIDRDGGSFEIDLVGVEDAYGCKRSIMVPGIVVNVRRVKPTARFYAQGGKRQVTILESEQASLPLRLTGDGPWRVKYRRQEEPEQIQSITLRNPNEELRVTKKGLYEILEVADSQCPGSVVAEETTYRVDWVPRPSAKLSSDVQAIVEPHNGSHILQPICEGIDDHVDLDLTGRPPFQIMYNVARDSESGGTKLIDQPTFSSIQPRTGFQLHTSEAARIYYEVKQIGDAAYPLAKNKDAVIPRSERLLFEQQVLRRPSARFTDPSRISYCLNDVLLVRDLSADGYIILEGTPPFQLQLSVRNLAASEIYTEILEIKQTAWKLNIPSYQFKSIGPHLITIDSVQDASHCEQSAPDPMHRSIWADVAETAAIVPFDRREHFCVGDATQFQLEGTPPWTIGYRINGKLQSQAAKVSPFSVVQQQPGDFVITSIAHQQKMCKTAVTDLRYTVHPLPSARVGHGKPIDQDIHEGDQAEIVFTLIGEPPFTFTYQRAELSAKKGVQGKVLETHTVSGVTTKEYSIFSALEGTWTITFISDRYCRYPSSSADEIREKGRL